MSVQSMLALIVTVVASVCIVAIIILLGWFLIWKAFLSKFRLVRELLGQGDEQQAADNNQVDRQPHAKAKKVRKD